jgi:hypothetical protein
VAYNINRIWLRRPARPKVSSFSVPFRVGLSVRPTPIQCPSELGCRCDQHPFNQPLAQDKVGTACRSPYDGQPDGQHIALLFVVKSFRGYKIWQFWVLSNSWFGGCELMSSPGRREFVDLGVVILCLALGAEKGRSEPAAATGSQDAQSQGPSPKLQSTCGGLQDATYSGFLSCAINLAPFTS